MSKHHLTRRGLLLGSLGAWSLAGCSNSASPRVYTLTTELGTALAGGPATLSVVGAAIPKYLDRPQIVRRGGGNQIEVAEFDRWAEPFGDMVTRVLIGDLSLRLPKTQVFRDDSPTATAASVSVQLDIARFDPDPDGTVVLALRWTLRSTAVLAEDSPRLTAKPASDSIPDLVVAMSDAMGKLADRIAAAAAGAS